LDNLIWKFTASEILATAAGSILSGTFFFYKTISYFVEIWAAC
jgi:hypothetical protein